MPGWVGCERFKGLLAYAPRGAASASSAPSASSGSSTTTGPTISINGRDVNLDDPASATHMLVRAVAFPDAPNSTYAVIADLLVNDQVRRQFRNETGVELTQVVALPVDGVTPLEARSESAQTEPTSNISSFDQMSLPLPSFSFLATHPSTTT